VLASNLFSFFYFVVLPENNWTDYRYECCRKVL